MQAPDPRPLPTEAVFLRPDDLPVMAHHLRGVAAIEVRQIGGPAGAGAEVVAMLEAAGLQVSSPSPPRSIPEAAGAGGARAPSSAGAEFTP